MPRRKRSVLSPANAVRLVEFLIDEGKILAHDIARYLHIAEIEARLRALRGGEVPVPHAKAKTTRTRKRPRRAASPARQASMKLQGQYLSLIARLPKTKRARYQKIARENGREKAIAAMKKDLGK